MTPTFLPSRYSGRTSAHHGVAPRHEPRRRPVIRIGEIDAGAQLRRHRQRGDDGVAAVAGDRIEQRLEPPHLHRAGNLDLLAEQPGQIDIEAGGIAVGAGEVERRIIGFGQKPDDGQPRQIGPVRPPPRVPEAGHRLGRGLGAGLGRRWRRRLRVTPRRTGPMPGPARPRAAARLCAEIARMMVVSDRIGGRFFRGRRRPYRPSGR